MIDFNLSDKKCETKAMKAVHELTKVNYKA